jgi:4-carboxymuconolactone decarboxylase
MAQNPLALAPKLAELNTEVLFGDVWERPELSKRERSLITVASLVSLYRTEQLVEAITHLAFYAGWPTAVSALARLEDVLEAREEETS